VSSSHNLQRDSSVGIATGWTTRVPLLAGPRDFTFFLFYTSSGPAALRSAKLPIQWVPRATFPWSKRLGRGADRSPPYTAEVSEWCNYTSTPPYVFVARSLIN
jgi:hypothetical protein